MDYKVHESSDARVKVKCLHVEGESSVGGMGSVIVDTDVLTCLDFVFCAAEGKSREDVHAHRARGGRKDGIAVVKKKLNNHSHLYYGKKHFDIEGLTNVSFGVKGVSEVVSSGAAFLAYEDAQEGDNNIEEDFTFSDSSSTNSIVAASIKAALMFESSGSVGTVPQTKVTAVAKMDFKKQLPSDDAAVSFMAEIASRHLSNLRAKFDRSIEIDNVRWSDIAERIKLVNKYTGRVDFAPRFEDKDGKVR